MNGIVLVMEAYCLADIFFRSVSGALLLRFWFLRQV